MASGSKLRPSYLRFFVSKGEEYQKGYGTKTGLVYSPDTDISLIRVTDQYLGSSSIGLYANDSDEYFKDIKNTNVAEGLSRNVYINPGAEIETGTGGSITVKGRNVESAGVLSAPGGTINMNAAYDLILSSGSLLSARGYILQDLSSLTTGLPMGYSVKDGGSVSLVSSNGSITIEQGAVVDISGSDIVRDYKWAADGDVVMEEKFSVPGSLSLSFYTDFSIEGEIKAQAAKDEVLNGGTLLLTKTNEDTSGAFLISGEELNSFVRMGFDSIGLKSLNELVLTGSENGSMDVFIPRDLTIDTPVLSASDGSIISISSPWITLTNTFTGYDDWTTQGKEGDAELTLEGDFIDINGLVTLSSFETAELVSKTDIRLSSDYRYLLRNSQFIGGLLQTGDLKLQADRIYGKTLSITEIRATGDLTILDNGDTLSGDLYSAGAEIFLSASNIYNYNGDIYAPYGTINLTATGDGGIVYLGDGSTLSTYSGAYINYGVVHETMVDGVPKGLFWINDEVNDVEIEEAPAGSVNVSGDSVIMTGGSVIDVSAGGTTFAYLFQQSLAGTEDPLGKSGQYVLLPDNSVYSPSKGANKTITIGKDSLIPAGTYYILGDEYAFVEGAIVIADLGTDPALAKETETMEGYAIVSGKDATVGTGLSSGTQTHYYSIRRAEDVLNEGEFQIFEKVAGNGGNIFLQGNTTIIEGTITGKSLSEDYAGGILALSGRNITVTAGDSDYSLPDDFNPEDDLQEQIENMMGKLIVADSSVSGQGMGDVILGDQDITETLTLDEGVSLHLDRIELNSKDAIEIKDNAVVMATSENGNGDVIFNNPDGSLSIGESVLIQASDNIELNTGTFHILGDLTADDGSINIRTEKIYFISDNAEDTSAAGGYITQSLWTSMSSADSIELGSGSELYFLDSFDMQIESQFILDASLIDTAGSNIAIKSGSVTLHNSGDASAVAVVKGSGTLSINADKIYLGSGTVSLSGFSGINLSSSGDMSIQGSGGLITGDADLNIVAASLKSSLLNIGNEAEDTVEYQVMDYSLNAGEGAVTLASNGGSYVTPSISGGRFGISAKSIIQSGILNMPGAYITYEATGSGESGVFLESGATIYAAGDDYAPGGSISLVSENGIVSLAQGSLINVAAGGQGDAGEVEIISPLNAAVVNGSLMGKANNGLDSSFTMDTAEIADFSKLNSILSAGGFTGSLDIRARKGNITLETTDILSTGEIILSADGVDGNGNIYIKGTIDASGAEDGSRVNIYAGNTLTLYSESSIIGAESGADILLSGEENVYFEKGAVIDAGGGNDASVAFRSVRSDSGLNMTLQGKVTGSDRVIAESVKVYNISDGVVDTEISAWKTETADFMQNAATLKTTLFKDLETDVDADDLYLAPVIDVRSTGNLTVNDWTLGGSGTPESNGYYDLSNTWHYDTDGDGNYETAGTLILRAEHNLTIDGSITDLLAENTSLYKDAGSMGWNIVLSAGAGSDFTAADPMKTISDDNDRDFTINSRSLVYTERGNIEFSSGGDTVINSINRNKIVSFSNMGFNLATYDGWIHGNAGDSLELLGGAIQSSLGDIDLDVKGDLTMELVKVFSNQFQGTIRSVGAVGSEEIDFNNYLAYTPGGLIDLNVGGAINGKPEKSAQWETVWVDYSRNQLTTMASFGNSGNYGTQGIVSMSGGDIRVRSGDDIVAAIGNFGAGDLSVYSNGDLDGRFLVSEGSGTLYTAGNAGKSPDQENLEIGLLDAVAVLTAQGSVELGAVLNPSLSYYNDDSLGGVYTDKMWNLTYTPDTEIAIHALSGDVELTGVSSFYNDELSQLQKEKVKVLPGNISLEAGRDIKLDSSFYM
ncbi:MAG: hypothetical protein PVG39_24505, partial [Desulfobacteraceae bacterium]